MASWGRLPLLSARQMVHHLRSTAVRGRPLVGLDVGRSYVGVAVSDNRLEAAAPHCVLRIRGNREGGGMPAFARSLEELLRRLAPSALVVGYPVVNSVEGTACTMVKQVMTEFSGLAPSVSMPVMPWDEQYSTAQAEVFRASLNIPYEDRRHVVDQVAAAIILQGGLQAIRHERSSATPGRRRRREGASKLLETRWDRLVIPGAERDDASV